MEQLCMRKTRRLAEKISTTNSKRYKEGTTKRWVGGAEMSTQDLYSRWATHKQDSYNLQRLSPGSERVWVPHWAPNTVVLYQEDKTQNAWLQSQRGFLSGEAEGCEKDSTVEGHTPNLTCSNPGRSSDLKGAKVRTSPANCRGPPRARSN